MDINYEEFRKKHGYVLNPAKSFELSKDLPSIKRKHVKSRKRTSKALREIDEKSSWSWYDEVKKRRESIMDKPMTFYRGNEKTGTQVFEEADMLAKALMAKGITKGDSIMACMSNVPEVLTLMLAANKCGAIVNFMGADFDKEFIKQIFSKNSKKVFIGTDDKFDKIASVVDEANFDNIILVSLADSLENGVDPYYEYDKDFYTFENKVPKFKSQNDKIVTLSQFSSYGKEFTGKFPEVGIDDGFTITYTSGSTKIGWPKEILHSSRPYISIARFHDPDLSRMPAMRNMRGLAHIPTHSNTNLVSSISDTLCQKCTVAFEPIYDKDFFRYSLAINEPGFVPATRSFLINTFKKFKNDPKLAGKDLSYILNIVSVGEDTSANEIKYIDSKLKELNSGCSLIPRPIGPITLSVGGGNCEHGGLFFTLFKSTRDKLLRKETGMVPFQLADIAVLREDGTECGYNEYGKLVANSFCTMKGYVDNPEANKAFHVTDAYGRVWGNCDVWAYINNNGNVVMKGRYSNVVPLKDGTVIPMFFVGDTMMDDNSSILSCEVVKPIDSDHDCLVAYIEKQPDFDYPDEFVLFNAERRCREALPDELSDKILFRMCDHDNPYPLTKSGKRSVGALEKAGIDEFCVKPDLTTLRLVPATEYLSSDKAKSLSLQK